VRRIKALFSLQPRQVRVVSLIKCLAFSPVGLLAGGLLCVAFQSPNIVASTTSLTRSQFESLAQNSITTSENFEQFQLGTLGSPVTLANSTYTAQSPFIAENFGAIQTKAMVSGQYINELRVFNSFVPNTTLFGADIRPFQDTFETLRVIAQGKSGVESVQQTLSVSGMFVAFYDPAGLTSVTVQNLGRSSGGTTVYTNYGIDNVITGRPVPEPGSLTLIVGLLAAWCRLVRWPKAH
jgi:hypothetical protein